MIEFSGKNSDWKSWSVKLLVCENRKVTRSSLLVKLRQLVLIFCLLKQNLKWLGIVHQLKMKLSKTWQFKYACIGGHPFVYTKNAAGYVAFNLVNRCYSEYIPEGNFRLAWDHFHSKFEPNTVSFLLNLHKIYSKR